MLGSKEGRILALEALYTPPPSSLFAEPIEYIFAEHFRQRVLCNLLEELAETYNADRELIKAVLAFLRNDFGLHVIDEEEDLFPLLRRRALPDDRIDDVLGELSHDHALDQSDARRIMDALEATTEQTASVSFDADTTTLLHRFSRNEHRHLILENAIVLPLARTRLTADDLRNLGWRMAARRGVAYPETPYAV